METQANKLEFGGKLEEISPSRLINKDIHDDFRSFFLILAMTFNDLKSLIFFQKSLEDKYRKPEIDEVSVHAGEYNGLILYTHKLLISTVSEFFIFLGKNKNIISNPKFLFLIKELDNDSKRLWAKMTDQNKSGSLVVGKMAKVRSNIAHHFDHSTGELEKGFRRAFYLDSKDLIQHKKAYYSFGNDMKLTRFYYADAAAADYINLSLNKEDVARVQEEISNMNFTLQSLLKAYISSIISKK